jgi:hypothetical protein
MNDTIDRTRSQKCYDLYEKSQAPVDKLDAERAFCLETAHAHALGTGSQQTAECIDTLINEIVGTCLDTSYDVAITVTVGGVPMYVASSVRDLGLDLDARVTPSWVSAQLRSAADAIDNNAAKP